METKENNIFYTVPPQIVEYDYNVDSWLPFLFEWSFDGYKPYTNYTVISMTDREIVAIRRGIYKLLVNLKNKINNCLTKPMFFRLSTRSPKDAWQKLAPDLGINEDDTDEIKKYKYKAQIELLKVYSFKDIYRLIQNSQRCIEDIDFHLHDDSTNGLNLSIILQDWRPSTGDEYRIFVKNSIIVAFCPFDTTSSSIDNELVNKFINSLSKVLPIKNYVVDIFIDIDKKLYFIEINPYSISTDPIIYSWDTPPLGPLFSK